MLCRSILFKYQNTNLPFFLSPLTQQPLVGQGLLIIEASGSHSDTPHSVELLWTSDQPNAKTTQHLNPCPPAGI